MVPPSFHTRKLGSHGSQLWQAIQAEYNIRDRGGIELLAQACAALDRAEALAETITRDGCIVYSRTGVPKSHPGIKDETACRAFVVRMLEKLGLNWEGIKTVGGQTSPVGWIPPSAS